MSKKEYVHAAKLLRPKLSKLDLNAYAEVIGIPAKQLTAFIDGTALPTSDQVGILVKTLDLKEDRLIKAIMDDLAKPAVGDKPSPAPQSSGSPHPQKRW